MEIVRKCNLCNSSNIKTIDPSINICKCIKCGYIFDSPRPTVNEIKQHYSNSENYDFWLSQEEEFDLLSKRRANLVRKFAKRGRLLDVGAGIGQFLFYAKEYFEVSGTEVAQNAIAVAKEKYNVKLIEGELEKLDFGAERFDVVTMFHVLEHVPNPGTTIDKCKDILRKNGLLIIAVPNDIDAFMKRPIKQLLRTLRIGRFKNYGKTGLFKIDMDRSLGEIHLSHFTAPVLCKFLQNRGFKVIESSLDPYYVGTSFKKVLHFRFFWLVNKLFKLNRYDTILVVAMKT